MLGDYLVNKQFPNKNLLIHPWWIRQNSLWFFILHVKENSPSFSNYCEEYHTSELFLQTLLRETARLGAHWATLLLVATSGPTAEPSASVCLEQWCWDRSLPLLHLVRQDGMGCVLPRASSLQVYFSFKFRPSCRNKLTPIQIRATSHQSQTQACLTNTLLPKSPALAQLFKKLVSVLLYHLLH